MSLSRSGRTPMSTSLFGQVSGSIAATVNKPKGGSKACREMIRSACLRHSNKT
jgi:hypothetical protein